MLFIVQTPRWPISRHLGPHMATGINHDSSADDDGDDDGKDDGDGTVTMAVTLMMVLQ